MDAHKSTELTFIAKNRKILANMPDCVNSYMRAIHNRTSPRTRYEYLKDIQMFFEYTKNIKKTNISPTLLESLDKKYFEEYFEYLEHYTRNGREYTNDRTSIKRKLSSIRNFFSYLFEENIISSDVTKKVTMPKLHKKEIIRLTQDEAQKFLHSVENGGNLTHKQNEYHTSQSVRDTAIVYLLLSSGIRVSECAELDITDIDVKNCSVRIVRKGGDEAIVYFSDEASEYINKYLDIRQTIKCRDPDEKALFLSSQKRRMSVRAIEIMIKKYALRSVPLKHITPHKLRATYATNLYDATGDIYLVAETLGHKDITTTKEHYANMSEKHKSENRNKVNYKK